MLIPAFGRRFAKDIDGKTTLFLWQGDKKTTLVQRCTRRKFNNCDSSGAHPPAIVIALMYRHEWFYDGCAADRSLAELVSGYRDFVRP